MDIYTEIILDHFKNPHNYGNLTNPTHQATEVNTSCGDKVTMQLIIDDKNKVKDIKFSGEGCAISQSACSLLTDQIKGKTIKEIQNLSDIDIKNLLKIEISPGRIKCALLGLSTIKKAIQ